MTKKDLLIELEKIKREIKITNDKEELENKLRIVFVLETTLLILNTEKSDIYRMLGLDRNSSFNECKKMLRKRIHMIHPSKNNSPGAREATQKIITAYDQICTEEKKRKFDQKSSPARSSADFQKPLYTGSMNPFSFVKEMYKSTGKKGFLLRPIYLIVLIVVFLVN